MHRKPCLLLEAVGEHREALGGRGSGEGKAASCGGGRGGSEGHQQTENSTSSQDTVYIEGHVLCWPIFIDE